MNIDASQRFIFGLEGSPEPLGSFKIDNIYVPVLGSPSLTNFEIRNEALSGYRWMHETGSTETYGSFRLQKFLAGSPTGIDLITFNDDGSFVFPGTTDAKYILQTANANLPNAQALGSLATGILKNTTTTGVLSIATPGTDYYAPGSDLNLNSHKAINLLDPTNPQDAATKFYVDSAIDNTFGPAVALPFVELDFNWNNTSGSSPFIFNHLLTNTSPFIKQYTYRISSIKPSGLGAGTRKWDLFYDLGDPTEPYALMQFQFDHPLSSPLSIIPFKIEMFGPSWSSNVYFSGTVHLDNTLQMNSHFITGVSTPIFADYAANKGYVDGSTITLTGSVTGSGNVNGSFATAFSNSQTVSGTTQSFNYSNALTSSIFSLVNTNSSAVTSYRSGSSTDYIETGYDGANDYSFINIQGPSNDRVVFRVNGTGVAALLQSGLFGLGTITPTAAKFQINGGVQNIVGEESCIRVISALNNAKIEIQNTTPTTGKLYELRSSSTGTFDITDRTGSATRFSITSAGNIGINMGLGTPNAPLQFVATAASRKIVLSETANNDHQVYAVGVNTNVFRYQVPASTADHVFYSGINSTTSNEVGRITGTGDFITPGVIYGHGPFGLIYFAGNATTTTVTAGVYTKMLGTTSISAVGLSQFSMPANNRLQYNGTPTGFFKISAIVSVQHNQILGASVNIALYKNGVQLVPSIMTEFQGGSGQSIILNTSDIINLSTNDYVEIYLTASANAILTPAYATLLITST